MVGGGAHSGTSVDLSHGTSFNLPFQVVCLGGVPFSSRLLLLFPLGVSVTQGYLGRPVICCFFQGWVRWGVGLWLRGGAPRVSMCSSTVSFYAWVRRRVSVALRPFYQAFFGWIHSLRSDDDSLDSFFFSFYLQLVQRARRLKPGPTEVRDCSCTLALILLLLPLLCHCSSAFFYIKSCTHVLQHPDPQVASSYCPLTMQRCCSVSF